MEYVSQITPAMVQTVDSLLQRNFANATADEMTLYTEWVRLNALQDDVFQQAKAARQAEIDANIAAFSAEHDLAMQALNDLADAARLKLERLINDEQA